MLETNKATKHNSVNVQHSTGVGGCVMRVLHAIKAELTAGAPRAARIHSFIHPRLFIHAQCGLT